MLIYWEIKGDSVFSTTESYERVIRAASPSSLSGPGPPHHASAPSHRHWGLTVIDVMVTMLMCPIKMTTLRNIPGRSLHSLHRPPPSSTYRRISTPEGVNVKAHALSEFLTVTIMQNQGIYEAYKYQIETQDEKNS